MVDSGTTSFGTVLRVVRRRSRDGESGGRPHEARAGRRLGTRDRVRSTPEGGVGTGGPETLSRQRAIASVPPWCGVDPTAPWARSAPSLAPSTIRGRRPSWAGEG